MKNQSIHRMRADIFGALANPHRLRMVEMLSRGELCLCEIVKVLDLDYSTVSRHLAVLKRSGIAGYRKDGKKVYYSLRVPCVLRFIRCFDEVLRKRIEGDTLCLAGDGGDEWA